MRIRPWARIAAAGLLGAALGCAQRGGGPSTIDAPAHDPAPWTGLEARDAPGDFHFVVVADRTGGMRPGVFAGAVEKIRLLRPAFVVGVGDLVGGYVEDPERIDAQWDEAVSLVAGLGAPFFFVPGNHDYSNPAMARAWRERFGPSYYHFRYRDVLFVVLNSEIIASAADPGRPVAGPDDRAGQLAFAEAVLDAHRDARWTFVLVHQPLWDRREVPEDWRRIEARLGDRPYTVLAGHVHRYTKTVRRERRYVTLATTGGASPLRGLDRGEFDHVALVSMTDDGPVIANLLLDGIHDEDVRLRSTRDRITLLERAVRAEPFTGAGDRFRAGEARFTIENEGPGPLRVEAVPRAGPDLVPELAEALSVEVAPGARETVRIPVRARRPADWASLRPAFVSWRLRTPKRDGSELVVERRSWLLPQRPFAVARAPREVRVDGRLDEWGALPFEVAAEPERGPADASARFAVAVDDDGLLVAVDVADPTPFNDPERGPRDQDGVALVLDARPAPWRDRNQSFFRASASGAVERMLFAWLVPGGASDDPLAPRGVRPLPDGVQRAVRRTARGYAAELRVPHAVLDERQGGPWRALRLEVSLRDVDPDGGRAVTHWWRPSRFGLSDAIALPGSGTFTRP